jgi:ferrous iron transport protein A
MKRIKFLWRLYNVLIDQSNSASPLVNGAAARSLLPLTLATPGEELTLVTINGGDTIRHRLTELGLVPGIDFRVLQSEGGPLLLAVRDSRLAIGRGMAHKILVQIKEPPYA